MKRAKKLILEDRGFDIRSIFVGPFIKSHTYSGVIQFSEFSDVEQCIKTLLERVVICIGVNVNLDFIYLPSVWWNDPLDGIGYIGWKYDPAHQKRTNSQYFCPCCCAGKEEINTLGVLAMIDEQWEKIRKHCNLHKTPQR